MDSHNIAKNEIYMMAQIVKKINSKARMTSQSFMVKNQRQTNKLKIIPYVGCKSGFSHIFDSLIPDNYGKKIYDLFGGGGGFTFYACKRFGSENVVYNDHNNVITNLITVLKKSPDDLFYEYQKHYKKSSPEYFLKIRNMSLDGLNGAGRFLYLAKNAFSGKIRFNSKNKFNCPMRKNSKCPQIKIESLHYLSKLIKKLKITSYDFSHYKNINDSFIYLDPPYMKNTNGHYNAVVSLDSFTDMLDYIEKTNNIMISEQNTPEYLLLGSNYSVYHVTLNRSLQYFTQNNSKEIIAINYE